ncbi:MAG TPA: insulinase family protein, partial [bacterium]|nr:insulinase family protein [bacterium]
MDVDLSRMALAFHIPSIHSPDLYPLDVLALLAGRGRSSRLFREVREKGIVYSVDAYSYTPYWPGLFVVEAVCEPGREDEAEEAVLKVLRSFAEEPVSAEELEKARLRVRTDYLHSLETAEGLAGDLGANYLLTGSLDFSRRYLEGIAGVAAEDVQRAARRYLDPARATSVRILPRAREFPASPRAIPAPGPVTRQILSNGLTLLVREDRSLPLISLRAVFRGGVLAEDGETNGIGALTARLLDRGTGSRTAEEIAAAMENFGGSLETYSARNSAGISLECTPDRFRETMELLGDLLTDCVFPPAEVEKEREALLAAIRARDDTPEGLARDLLLEAVFPEGPYRLPVLGRAGAVSGITGDQLAEFYRRIYCGRNGVVAVFGDIDAADARPLGEEFLGALPPGERLSRRGRAQPLAG